MGDIKPSNNMLHKTKDSESSILNQGVGLDPVPASYIVSWIEKSRNVPG